MLYKYDALGNMTEQATANGTQTTKYTYDRLSRLTKLTDPMLMPESYSYDANNNMVSKTDRKGTRFIYTFDAMNRPLKTTASGVAEFIENTYTKTGAVLTEKNAIMTITNKYDSLGRLINQSETGGIVKTYAYDRAGNRTSFMLKRNSITELNTAYTYDAMNRLQTVKEGGVTQATYTYDANGNRASLTYPGGYVTNYTYNEANLVTGLTNKSNSIPLSGFAYSYYLDGNQYQKTDSTTSEKTTYTYDKQSRLAKEALVSGQGNLTTDYTFDSAGNRATMKTVGTNAYQSMTANVSYVYDKNNRLLSETDGSEKTSYSYDANGNQVLKKIGDAVVTPPTPTPTPKPTPTPTPLPSNSLPPYRPTLPPIWTTPVDRPTANSAPITDIQKNTTALDEDEFEPTVVEISLQATAVSEDETVYAYDIFNRLVSVSEGTSGSTLYTYRPDGLRQSKIADAIITHLWDGANIVADVEGSSVTTYIRGVNLIASKKGSVKNYYLYNAHGDVVKLGSMGEYSYDAFGNALPVLLNVSAAAENPFRYSGEYFDKETETYYLRARYYDPASGRFWAEDPIRDGLNYYTYVSNNPIRFIDPSGLAEYKLGGLDLAPQFSHDSGFVYDPNAIATWNDRFSYAEWYTKGRMAYEFAWWLQDASQQYLHYLGGSGTDRTIDYGRAYKDDSVIKSYIDNEIVLMQNFAQSSYLDGAGNAFEIIGGLQGIPNGDVENWQKTIGAHYVYGHGSVTIDNETNMATMIVNFVMEDMYNFNPGMSDIATGTPDDANGRFAVLGWANEFKTLGFMYFTITWNIGDTSKSPIITVGKPR